MMDKKKVYSFWFLMPALIIFTVFFLIPTVSSLYFSMTVWDINGARFCGLDNFKMFFQEDSLSIGIRNTMIYAVLTSVLKLIPAFFLAVLLTSRIKTKNILRSVLFFPSLLSLIAIGIMFKAMLHPSKGIINQALSVIGLGGTDWLGNTKTALGTVIVVSLWEGLCIATMMFIAGIQAIDANYYEAADIDGASWWQKLRYITMPLTKSARNSIIILAFIDGVRSFELIWAMTGGGPGFATDVLSSIVYKQYAAGYYGLSTAGNVIMLILISCLAYPLQSWLLKREEESM